MWRSTRLLNNSSIGIEPSYIFSAEKTLSVNPVFSKQNDKLVAIGSDDSEHLRLSTTKHPA